MATPHVLITGAGGSIALNLARSLASAPRPLRLFGCDASRFFVHLAPMPDKAVVASAASPKEYVDQIRELVERWKIDLILASNMGEILLLAEQRESLGAKVFLPSLEAIRAGADKWRTYELLKAAGIPVPRTRLIEQRSQIDEVFSEFGSPVWFRGRGVPGRGVGVASLPARTAAQAEGWIDFHDAYGQMTAAEFLPGDNLTWLGLWKGGKLVASQGRKRISYVISHVSPSGITGAPSVSVTVNDPRLNEIGARAMLALDSAYDGVGFVDFKCDVRGEPLVTEVNVGRFGTTHHFYAAAGANFASWYVQLALGEVPSEAKPHNTVPPDLYWIRTLDGDPILVAKGDLDRYTFVPKR